MKAKRTVGLADDLQSLTLDREDWLIELTSKSGVTLSRVREFNPEGGVKRFTQRPSRESDIKIFLAAPNQSHLHLDVEIGPGFRDCIGGNVVVENREYCTRREW